MQLILCVLAAVFVIATCGGVLGAGEWPDGTAVLPKLTDKTVYFGAADDSGATMQAVTVVGQPFDTAARVTVAKKISPDHRVQFILRTVEPVAKDQVCLLRFYLRALDAEDETSQGRVRAYFQKAGPNWHKSADRVAEAGSKWRRFDLPFTPDADYAAGEAEMGFAFGARKQTVEVGGIEVIAFGPDVAYDDLPRTRQTYAGRKPDAPWRQAAEKRIADHRMGNLTIKVTDASGRPMPRAQVTVALQRHAFGFGSAVTAHWIMSDSRTGETYRRHVLDLFNRVVLENDLKWKPWENGWGERFNRPQTLAALKWLTDRDIVVHGHVMVWPSWRHLPERLQERRNDREALRRTINEHIVEQVTQAGPYVTDWDVINEPFSNHDLMDLLGDAVMVEWFKTARRADPTIKLMINDYGILTAGELDTAHQAHYEQTIRYLLDRDAPLDAIGLQGHFGGHVTPPEKLMKIIDRFARFDLPLHVTEFDVNTDDEPLQADYTRDFMTVVFSRPEFDSFTMWGFWEGAHWRGQAAMYRRDWQPKPNAEAYRKLVSEKWHTREAGRTDGRGVFTCRGFCGAYEITVEADGATKKVEADLPRDGTTVNVALD